VRVQARGRRGRALVAAVAGGTLVAAAGAAVVLERPGGPSTPVAAPTVAPVASRGPLLPLPAADELAPTRAGLAAAVDAVLADPALGGTLAVSVVDATTGEPLLEQRADTLSLPASTVKIATAVAALTVLDPRDRLETRVVAGPAPGDVVLVGGGDTTLASPGAEPGYPEVARLDDLAAQVRAALGPVALRRVLVDDTLYSGDVLGPGWKPTYVTEGSVAPVMALMVDAGRVRLDRRARHADPALAAARALAAQLQPAGAPPVAVERAAAAPRAAVLGTVRGPTVAQLTEAMLLRSDNDIAESLARQVALSGGQPASFAGVAAAVPQAIAPLLQAAGLGPDVARLVDGSGLSRLNALAPGGLTRVLAAVVRGDLDRYSPVLTGLPVGGYSGTLSDRYRKGPALPAAGVVRAKTGTLNGVSALAGLVRTRDGRLLAFDVAADAVPLGATRRAEAALDRLVGAFASCGC
jgi:D-alanyl-D-alanine carboxypeptidase/D-alanyl-D-alanine-endopeptidase (penicillin-binding protein 4)